MATFVALTEEDPAYELADVLAKVSHSAEQKEQRVSVVALPCPCSLWLFRERSMMLM